MSSLYTVSPSSLYDHRDHSQDHLREPYLTGGSHHNHNQPVTPAESQLLSPYSSHIRSNSASPIANSNTPAESSSTLSIYQSDFSGDLDDPFFGVNFDNLNGGSPTFLEDQLRFGSTEHLDTNHIPMQNQGTYDAGSHLNFAKPLSEPVASSLSSQNNYDGGFYTGSGATASHQHHSNVSQPEPEPVLRDSNQSAPQPTLDTNAVNWSSDGRLAPAALNMAAQSPRVMVSEWGRDEQCAVHPVARTSARGTESPRTMRSALSNNDVISTETLHRSSVSRDTQGNWGRDAATGHRGLGPEDRPSAETLSINQLDAGRQVTERNQLVDAWVADAAENADRIATDAIDATYYPPGADKNSSDDIPLGNNTENKYISGQAYYQTETQGGGLTQEDIEIMQQSRNWGDAPMVHSISQMGSSRHQPESSQAAIAKFEMMCRDNDSIVSRAATWGTRRRSLPSLVDVEGVLNGNFLKKLSLKADSSRRPSLLRKIPSLVRRPSASQLLKRKGSNADETASDELAHPDRRESRDSLAPPSRSTSWGIKQKPTPSLNTALVGMATNAAAIGTSHARSGSISATSITSPKSSFGFPNVKNSLRRPRSKTELPKGNTEGVSNIVGMLKKQGGPPVAQLARSQPNFEKDDDDESDDYHLDDSDMNIETGKGEDIIPTLAGFQQHIRRLNPNLPHSNQYLVDRIAHHMIIRYKNLQKSKIKHLKAVNQYNCQSGVLCIAQGGSAQPLDSRGDTRGVDPLSARPDSSDGDSTPRKGDINHESFPTGIPMPPTTTLPAEFECQLCYTRKKFQKPSEWTKHVHEDVQPFTCTWDQCRDPKMFKRKADWVRHENEGHRHLEWWTCDVDDCRHTCYRRDNFLQHLVREHKFQEPKVKTKAAIKKAGGNDLTWQKVERCHVETRRRPQDEPCRFCGKTFPTWKKLTVHLSKHMEYISLPALKLVATEQLNEDTSISPVSPVQHPSPRNFPMPIKQEPQAVSPHTPQRPHAFSNPNPVEYDSHSPFGYSNMPRAQMQPSFYNQNHAAPQQFDAQPRLPPSGLMMLPTTGFAQQQQYHTLPVTTGVPYEQAANTSYMSMPNQLEPFPLLEQFGIQDTSGGQHPYDTMTDPIMQNVEQQYSNQGSVSPYPRSPHQGHTRF
ncbi:uncharacterized protein BCR38DRAFT_338876 [Pseudomassariella vexata]|uniref:C2H2-type domain-containing protein n=1 Tax=Pseudomassariella vexata TaxID=1141098 RepID=A0A1Y2E441_9PEZI|nr:uncharacterized protein BCR38DRAFT_338876 [Pseudomassariella vexata]ORY66323.1 hypothetical protein BCR38DRAFT_338876 [Pseudomassariella vexata]